MLKTEIAARLTTSRISTAAWSAFRARESQLTRNSPLRAMRILVTHLTRMKPGYVCIAGLDDDSNNVRPVAGQLPRSVVAAEGGPFDLACVVAIGATRYVGSPPDVEDYSFTPADAKLERKLSGPEFWQTLDSVAKATLQEIFGLDLKRRWSGATVDVGCGKASLGVLRPRGNVTITKRSENSLRIAMSDPDLGRLGLSLTDLRFVNPSQTTVNSAALEEATQRLAGGEPTLLSVGLARAWQASQDSEPRHWLQVNNLHFSNHADWRLV